MALFLNMIFLLVPIVSFLGTDPCKESGTLSEGQLRAMATEKSLPVYPEDAKKSGGAGLVVLQLHLSENNKVDKVKILEAPSSSIAEASKAAVLRWKFPPRATGDTEICMTGKLTFYFVIEDGKAFVKNPRRYDTTHH